MGSRHFFPSFQNQKNHITQEIRMTLFSELCQLELQLYVQYRLRKRGVGYSVQLATRTLPRITTRRSLKLTVKLQCIEYVPEHTPDTVWQTVVLLFRRGKISPSGHRNNQRTLITTRAASLPSLRGTTLLFPYISNRGSLTYILFVLFTFQSALMLGIVLKLLH